MTLIEQRAVGRPSPCMTCKGRKSCCSTVAMICPAFAAWMAVLCGQRAHEEYREHLRWMVRCMAWRNNESETDV